jgi:enamine deaminase RidA (YjgF/YER057c/UK114 family)
LVQAADLQLRSEPIRQSSTLAGKKSCRILFRIAGNRHLLEAADPRVKPPASIGPGAAAGGACAARYAEADEGSPYLRDQIDRKALMGKILYVASPLQVQTPPLSAATRHGELVFISGTPGYHDDGTIAEGDFEAQFHQAVTTLRELLLAAGSSMRSILKVNVLLTREADVQAMNLRYRNAFGPAPFPARTTSVVRALPDPRMLLEIECIAVATDALEVL